MRRLPAGVLVLFFLMSSPAVVIAGAGWTDDGAVAELTVTDYKQFLVKLDVAKNPSGCKNSNTFYIDYNAFGAKMMFGLLRDAALYEKRVRVFVTGGCEINGYSEISRVSLLP